MDSNDRDLNRTTTINPAFNAVARDDFTAMLNGARYTERSDDFEVLIARTNEHFWNPEDPDYIDFDVEVPSDEPLIPFDLIPERHSAIWDTLDDGARVQFANETLRLRISGILHGEQGALSLSTGLADMLLDAGAQEFALNQAREEGRHVHGFALYANARFGGDIKAPPATVDRLLHEMVSSNVIYEKLIGMQMLVEGLAMGLFTQLYQQANDPVLRRLTQLVMTDEAFHHRFGIMWAKANVPGLSEELANQLEDYALAKFQDLMMNLVAPEEKSELYRRCGIEQGFAVGAMKEVMTDERRRRLMRDGSNLFRTLIKTLWNAGLITERTRPNYDFWVDMDEVAGEGEEMVGDGIAEEGIADLAQINAGKKKIVRTLGVR